MTTKSDMFYTLYDCIEQVVQHNSIIISIKAGRDRPLDPITEAEERYYQDVSIHGFRAGCLALKGTLTELYAHNYREIESFVKLASEHPVAIDRMKGDKISRMPEIMKAMVDAYEQISNAGWVK